MRNAHEILIPQLQVEAIQYQFSTNHIWVKNQEKLFGKNYFDWIFVTNGILWFSQKCQEIMKANQCAQKYTTGLRVFPAKQLFMGNSHYQKSRFGKYIQTFWWNNIQFLQVCLVHSMQDKACKTSIDAILFLSLCNSANLSNLSIHWFLLQHWGNKFWSWKNISTFHMHFKCRSRLTRNG